MGREQEEQVYRVVVSEREERIYDALGKLRAGDINDKRAAFRAMGVLANESAKITMDERLDIVESIMIEYREKKARGEIEPCEQPK